MRANETTQGSKLARRNLGHDLQCASSQKGDRHWKYILLYETVRRGVEEGGEGRRENLVKESCLK